MKKITFINTEIDPTTGKILDLGGIKEDDSRIHCKSTASFAEFLQGVEYLYGHNILRHDLIYIKPLRELHHLQNIKFIDTLYLSPLLFPTKP